MSVTRHESDLEVGPLCVGSRGRPLLELLSLLSGRGVVLWHVTWLSQAVLAAPAGPSISFTCYHLKRCR